jgi:hypothetical protein
MTHSGTTGTGNLQTWPILFRNPLALKKAQAHGIYCSTATVLTTPATPGTWRAIAPDLGRRSDCTMVSVDALVSATPTRAPRLELRSYVPHDANDQALDALFISTLLYETGPTTI